MNPSSDDLSDLILPQPQTACLPAFWKFDQIRSLLVAAERTTFVLENPGLHGVSQITQTLVAGVKLVMPGETVPTHRHTASLLRFVLEGSSAYTKVDGARTTMHPGDFILAPSWNFNDYGNPGETPTIWLDALDSPIVNLLGSSFAEPYPDGIQRATKAELSVPIFNYSYSRSRDALQHFSRTKDHHPAHGMKMQYQNPKTGSSPVPTIGAFLQMLPAGFRGAAYRGTDASVYCVTEGRGRSRVGASVFEWGVHDIFVAPSWCFVAHEADEAAVLFSFSDRAAQIALGLWREEIQPA